MKKDCEQNSDSIPEFFLALSLVFNRDAVIGEILGEIQNLGIERPTVVFPKHESFASIACVNIAIIKNEHFWELDDALTEMFVRIDYCLPQLKTLVEQYQGSICIDIAFYQYGTYPSISFSSENIRKISFLDAEVSIDPY